MKQIFYLFLLSSIYCFPINTDRQAYNYCITHPDTFIGIVWPITPGNDEKIKQIMRNYGTIHYQKNVRLTYDQAFTLLKTAHRHISDMKEHVRWYFPGDTFKKQARIFVLTFNKSETAVACKHAIRHLFNLQYRSIHINDTHDETIELAQFFFG